MTKLDEGFCLENWMVHIQGMRCGTTFETFVAVVSRSEKWQNTELFASAFIGYHDVVA